MQGENYLTRKIGTFKSDLMNEPFALQGMMNEVLKGLPLERVHIDDVLIFLKALDEDMTHVKTVVDRI